MKETRGRKKFKGDQLKVKKVTMTVSVTKERAAILRKMGTSKTINAAVDEYLEARKP